MFNFKSRGYATGVILKSSPTQKGGTRLRVAALFTNDEDKIFSKKFWLTTVDFQTEAKVGDFVKVSGSLVSKISEYKDNKFLDQTIFVEKENKFDELEIIAPTAEMKELTKRYSLLQVEAKTKQ